MSPRLELWIHSLCHITLNHEKSQNRWLVPPDAGWHWHQYLLFIYWPTLIFLDIDLRQAGWVNRRLPVSRNLIKGNHRHCHRKCQKWWMKQINNVPDILQLKSKMHQTSPGWKYIYPQSWCLESRWALTRNGKWHSVHGWNNNSDNAHKECSENNWRWHTCYAEERWKNQKWNDFE